MAVVRSISVSGGVVTNATGGAVGTSDISDEAITLAKLQHLSSGVILGRGSIGTGDVESLTLGDRLTISSGVLESRLVDQTVLVDSEGTPGDMVFDSSYLYVCVATDTWRRVALSSF